jgi:hypothetical protein
MQVTALVAFRGEIVRGGGRQRQVGGMGARQENPKSD